MPMIDPGSCGDMTIEDVYISGNDLDWEPAETTYFEAKIKNPNPYTSCGVTVLWKLDDQTLGADSMDAVAPGSVDTLWDDADHHYALEYIEPGSYPLKVVVGSGDYDGVVAETWWTDDNGDKIMIDVYGPTGNPPGAESSIVIDNITMENDPVYPGQTSTATIAAKNAGEISGSKTFDVEAGVDGEPADVIETLQFSLDSGESTQISVDFTVPSDTTSDGMNIMAGSAYGEARIELNPIKDRGLSITTGANKINAVHTLYNAASTSVKVNVDAHMEHVDSGSIIWQQTYEVTIPGEGTTNVEFSNETSVQPGNLDDFKVCSEIV